ncbi:MAG: hypothetical protein O2894_04485 [Planctomycetota bacterium]|nr:hypothetical protein [Planctomycetota bacterium]
MSGRYEARVIVLALAACLLSACGDPAVPLPGPVELPTATVVGAMPPRAGRVDITITSDARVFVGTTETTIGDIRPLILAAAGARVSESASEIGEEEVEEVEDVLEQPVPKEPPVVPARDPLPRPAGPFLWGILPNADVLLRLDRYVPWDVVHDLLIACARDWLYRVFVAVDGFDGAPGAIAVFLPRDSGLSCENAPLPGVRVHARLGDGAEGLHGRGAWIDALRRQRPLPESLAVLDVSVDLDVAWQDVVALLDAALRADCYGLLFVGRSRSTETQAPPLAERMEIARATPPARLTIRDKPAVDQAFGSRPPPRRMPGYVGFSNDESVGDELEEELEEELLEEEPLRGR